jgi:alkylation response protein AidB-like acyl-CoA dehydrogenase
MGCRDPFDCDSTLMSIVSDLRGKFPAHLSPLEARIVNDDDLKREAAELFRGESPPGQFKEKPGYEDYLAPGRQWLRRLATKGWSAPSWPSQYGGCGASLALVQAIRQVLSHFEAPDLYAFGIGIGIVGPTILVHGTDEQKAKWLSRIASGNDIICQMFSEPDAGSDLANVSIRGERDGDTWRIEGQKVWTSRAAYSDWGMCLTRTDPEAPKHRGLTMFMLDMDDPAIEVRPLKQMDGEAHFNEIFVSGAVIPDAWRVGDVGTGWAVAMTVLANERNAIGARSSAPTPGPRSLPVWLKELANDGILADPVVCDRAMRVYALEQVSWLTALRAAKSGVGRLGPSASGGKLRQVQAYKARSELQKDAAGPFGMLTDHSGHKEFLFAPSMSLMGGTDEVQRNVLGERVLGLPKEPRLDRDVPWSQSRRGLL